MDYQELASQLEPVFDKFALSFWAYGIFAIFLLVFFILLFCAAWHFGGWLGDKIIFLRDMLHDVRKLRKEVDQLKSAQAPAAPAADQKEAE